MHFFLPSLLLAPHLIFGKSKGRSCAVCTPGLSAPHPKGHIPNLSSLGERHTPGLDAFMWLNVCWNFFGKKMVDWLCSQRTLDLLPRGDTAHPSTSILALFLLIFFFSHFLRHNHGHRSFGGRITHFQHPPEPHQGPEAGGGAEGPALHGCTRGH